MVSHIIDVNSEEGQKLMRKIFEDIKRKYSPENLSLVDDWLLGKQNKPKTNNMQDILTKIDELYSVENIINRIQQEKHDLCKSQQFDLAANARDREKAAAELRSAIIAKLFDLRKKLDQIGD